MTKILCSLLILTLLSGCWCGIEEQDPSDVPDYFSGCWDKFAKNQPKNNTENNNNADNKADINKEEGIWHNKQ